MQFRSYQVKTLLISYLVIILSQWAAASEQGFSNYEIAMGWTDNQWSFMTAWDLSNGHDSSAGTSGPKSPSLSMTKTPDTRKNCSGPTNRHSAIPTQQTE